MPDDPSARPRPFRASLALAALSGLLLALSFPPTEWSWLAFVGLAPLLASLEGRRPLASFFLGWCAGLVYYTVVVWWVTNSIIHYGYIAGPVAWAVLFLLTAAMAFFPGIFALLASRYTSGGVPAPARVLTLACFWTALEWVRGHLLFLSFPWGNLAYSQFRNQAFIQHASLTGPYGTTFLLAASGAGIYGLFRFFRKGRRNRPMELAAFVLALVLIAPAWIWGAFRIGSATETGKDVRVAVLQGNIQQDVKWDPAFREKTFENYRYLSLQAAGSGADLIVWPETATPFYYQDSPHYRSRLMKLARETGRPLVFGSPAYVAAPGGINLRNRVYMIDGTGKEAGWYDKLQLVPFGEFVPLKEWLTFAGKLVQEVGDFTPGEGYRIFVVGEKPFGAVICYEIIFPEIVRNFVARGAVFMVNLTNDAWFGRTSASLQHFSQMVFRAVENGVPVVRAANTGISGFVDDRGRILLQSDLFVRGYFVEDLSLGRGGTFYTRHGDIIVWISMLVLAAATLFMALGGRKGKGGRD
jgi:apolipoprotein N-acyltransferase